MCAKSYFIFDNQIWKSWILEKIVLDKSYMI